MQPSPMEQLTDAIIARGAQTVHVAIPDVDGGLRERRLPLSSVPAALGEAATFCNVLHEWDVTDTVHGPGPFVGESIAVDPASVRGYPFEPTAVWLLADFTGPHRVSSPRELLKTQIARAAQLGFLPKAAFEFEWLVFDEQAKSLREKRWSQPLAWAPDNRCWDAQSGAINADVVAAQQDMLAQADIGVFGLGMELGAGCMEATLLATDALRAADDAAFFKLASRAFFRRRNQTACFMAQSDANAPGLSGHIHLSLQDPAGHNLFAAPANELSLQARHFVGGVLKLLPQHAALPLHTVNAYRRLSPGNWAPRTPTWSFGGYTTAIRAVSGLHPQARLEFRIPGADVNPWLGLAMFLGAGLWGIEHAVEPPSAVTGDGRTHTTPDLVALPHDLLSAARALHASREAREIFGSAFIDPYVASRHHEFDSLRRAVSAEEKARYFEIA